MKRCKNLLLFTTALLAAAPAFAQDAAKKDNQPGDAQMMATMLEMAKPGENHQILADTTGSWKYTIKWWTSPDAPPRESAGTCKTKPVMDGRYFVSDHSGKMSLPGPDGKMADLEFKGMGTEGYDNAKKKFVASWIDNMGTGIMMMEGAYDPSAKTITYTAEEEKTPGVKTKVREVIKYTDKDHHTIDFFEDHAGTATKTMELVYTRLNTAPSPVAYFEVAGPDASRLADFYRGVFGWEIKPGPFPGYFDIAAADGSSPRGGIRQEEKSERVLYVRVPDLKAALDQAVKHGAKVVIPPTVVKGVVSFALFEDPAGNRTGLIL